MTPCLLFALVASGALAADSTDAETKTDLQTLVKYQNQRLQRATYNQMSTGVVPVGSMLVPYTTSHTGWAVYDGGGAPLLPRDFAERVGDQSTAQRIQRDKKTATGMVIGGAAAAVGGLGLLVGAAVSPTESDNLVGVVGGMGLVFGVGMPLQLIGIGRVKRQGVLGTATYYTTDEADGWVSTHNTRLQNTLGLPDDEIRGIELGGEQR